MSTANCLKLINSANLNSPWITGSAILLRVKTQCLRITKSLLGDYIAADSEDTVKTDVKSMIFFPTGEEVTVSSDDSYRGTVITSNDRTHCLQSKENERRKKSSTPAPQTGSVLLTELDVKNRNRGYSLFLPDDKTKCDDYWRLGYGINLISDVAGIIGGDSGDNYHLSEVTMELGDLRIIPIQLLVR